MPCDPGPEPVRPSGPARSGGTVEVRRATAHRMGSTAEVVVRGPGPDPQEVLEHLAHLEADWTRFSPDSELSRLGRAAGRGVVVGTRTAGLVARSRLAWELSGGRFDPTVAPLLEELGYDRDLALLPPVTGDSVLLPARPGDDPGEPTGADGPTPGMAGVHADETSGWVHLPPGVRIDPGGLGKGLAADLAVAAALAAAAPTVGVLVSVGGDLRVGGAPPPGGWTVAVDHGSADRPDHVGNLSLSAGALATSSVLRRRWTDPRGRAVHHVIDPRTGRPATGIAGSVTVLAAEAWWAEAVATAVLVGLEDPVGGGVPGPLLDGPFGPVGVLATLTDGSRVRLGPLADRLDIYSPPVRRADDHVVDAVPRTPAVAGTVPGGSS